MSPDYDWHAPVPGNTAADIQAAFDQGCADARTGEWNCPDPARALLPAYISGRRRTAEAMDPTPPKETP